MISKMLHYLQFSTSNTSGKTNKCKFKRENGYE